MTVLLLVTIVLVKSKVHLYLKVSVYNCIPLHNSPLPRHPPVTQFRLSASTQVSKCHSVVLELIYYLSQNRGQVLNTALLLDLWCFMVLLILDLSFLESSA